MTVTLSVTDAGALWEAAAGKVMASVSDATLEDVTEMVGPREDPSIADCIAILASPAAVAGCVLDDFAVEALCAVEQAAAVANGVAKRPSCADGVARAHPVAVNDEHDTPRFSIN